MPAAVAIEIVSDVICPWCFIGKRRLERALALLGDEVAVKVAWLPFQLNPEMPPEGIARADYRRAKFGEQRSRALDARVAAEAAGEGLAFALERQARTPNTFAAHQLVELAQERGAGDDVVEALFRAYFEQARNTGDRGVLKEIAVACGVPVDELETRWADDGDRRRVAQLEERMKALGISGVPTFIFDRKLAISGAHPPEALAAAIREAAVPPR
jgi:predicted DsbA family dithiol-disulfide isomerase